LPGEPRWAIMGDHFSDWTTSTRMAIRDTLPPILRGDEAAQLSADAFARLDAVAQEAARDRQLPQLRDECAARMRQGGASHGVAYLLSQACRLNGEMERAHQTLLALGDKLASTGQWEALAVVAERALEVEESGAAAHLLVAAHEALKLDPQRIEALQRAWAIIPDDLDVGLTLAIRLGEAGRGSERRAMLAELLERFAQERRYAGLEEAALEFVEHEEHDGLVRLVHTLPLLVEQGAGADLSQLLGIAFPALAQASHAGDVLDAVRKMVTRTLEKLGPVAAERFRPMLVESLRQGPGRLLPEPTPVFEISGVADPAQPLLQALERFDAIAALPPGRAVHHSSFGAGRVTANDAETVWIDFARSKDHRMPIVAARRSLTALPDDDLRLLAATDPEGLARLRSQAPADVVLRALHALGGAADATKLKVFLVGSQLVPAKDWNVFWRKARAAADKDPRIDSSRAFEQSYRVAPEGVAVQADAGPLPALEPRKPVKQNLGTLRKFLSQHPHADSALARRFGKYIKRAVLDEDGDRVDRARAGLFFARWFPERAAEWTAVLKTLWDQGLALSDLPGEDEQLALLRASHDADAILSALDSRFAAVRVEAERMLEHQDARGRAELRRTLLAHATRYPGAALRLIDEELARPPEGPEPWRLFCAALALIEERPKPSTADKVLRWLEVGGAFDAVLRGRPCPEEIRLTVRILLRQWRSSDRYMFPALEAAERFGLAEEAELVRRVRAQRTERMFDGVGQLSEDIDLPVMTRATFERLRKELERLERELRTTIPAAIQKARELGDLKENAEYHSAKLKQANVSKLVASLQLRLARARFVDDIAFKDGIAGVGTEVVLEGDDEVVTYWILGEEEHHHGAHVVSFQAPVGRALVGRSIGDDVEIGEGAQRKRYRVVSVERRLPPLDAEPEPATGS